MRILFATPYKSSAVGGISKWAEHIVGYSHYLKDQSLIIDVLPMNRNSFVVTKSMPIRLIQGLQDYSSFIYKAHKMLKSGQYDVMHLCTSASFSLVKDLIMLKVAKRHNVPTILHFHFGRIPELAQKKNWEWKMICHAIRNSNNSVVIDNYSYHSLRTVGFENIRFLPNPAAPYVLNYVSRYQGVIKREPRMVLYAGHCVRNKGIYELVKACKDIPDIELVLVGRITEKVKSDLKESSGDGNWLHILGEKPFLDVLKLMLLCGVFTLPSYSEGFPNVILESMACGCAIVSTHVGAIPEMLDAENNVKCGICVPPKDIRGLRESIKYLIDNPQIATSLGVNAQRRVNDQYTIDQIWNKLHDIWEFASVNKNN